MTLQFLLIDIAPDPVSTGIAVVVVLFVVGLALLMVGALVFFLWYRKRSLRGSEMIRAENNSTAARHQVNNPNQP